MDGGYSTTGTGRELAICPRSSCPLGQVVTHLYRPYDLRHTSISRWIEAGIPVAQVASWAGNTADVIWRHYANTTQTYEIPVL